MENNYRTQQEFKTDYLETSAAMLEVAAICLRSYKETKDEKFIGLYKDALKESRYWGTEASNIGL